MEFKTQDEILSADPSVENFRHIGSHSLHPGLLSCGQFFLGTFMVDSVKFINHIVLDRLEGTDHALAGFAFFLDVGLKMASIIMNEKVWFDLWQSHCGHNGLNLILEGLIHNMLMSCHYMT